MGIAEQGRAEKFFPDMWIAANCQTNNFAVSIYGNTANTSVMPNEKEIKSTKPIITHLSHKSSREGLDVTHGHTGNMYLLGFYNFDGVISLVHYLFLANGLD